MDLRSRFVQLRAPKPFVPSLGVPLRWKPVSEDNNDWMVVFDPEGMSGFVLRLLGDHLDVAFHLDGRIARASFPTVGLIENEDEQEKYLESLFPYTGLNGEDDHGKLGGPVGT